MDFFTHIIVSVALANQIRQDEDSSRAFLLGGLTPDFDVFFTWLPALIPQLFILQHRGLFHTVFIAPFMVMAVILSTKHFEKTIFIKRLQVPFHGLHTKLSFKTVVWGMLGFCLHLFMDIITQGGLPLFYPLVDQRITSSTISVFDPVITILSSILVLRFLFRKITDPEKYSSIQFKRVATSISILFIFLLGIYGSFEVVTIVIHSPTSTSPDIIPIFRWTIKEKDKTISISYVNQLSQTPVKTYNYTSLTYNQSDWDFSAIESVIEEAKRTLDYQKFKFQLGSDTRIAWNVTFNEIEHLWEISCLDTLRDAQNRFYGLTASFIEAEVIIHLNQN
ncbi:MAG: metal-dependent hydrolase [Promethearchaeota archaeon]